MRTTTTMAAALTAVILAGCSPSTAAAESACGAVGGSIGPAQTCHVHSETAGYTLDFQFPVDYPDQQPLADFLTQRRDDFIDWITEMPSAASSLNELDIIGDSYRSGAVASGTQSLVLTIGRQAGVHPVTTYKSFNYDLNRHVPITFDTLFKPGARPQQVLNPIVQRELDKHGATGSLTLEDLGAKAYENFAITDDAVIFFFNQDGLLPHERGPLTVEVPRTELAGLLA
jgi:hypothetical protein